MRQTLVWISVRSATALAAIAYVSNVEATPALGFRGTTLALGRFEAIDAANHELLDSGKKRRHHKNLWVSTQRTKGASDLYVQSNTWDPGGTTGWHTHPGHSLIIVTAGTVTTYEGDDPSCTPHVYTTGMGFVDEGGDHVHVIRNEDTTAPAQTMAVQLIPAGAVRRVDAPGNPACGF